MKPLLVPLFLVAVLAGGIRAENNIQWLVEYAANALPAAPQWQAVGDAAVAATVTDGALRLRDDATDEQGHFRASFRFDPAREIVVEARVRVTSMASGQSKPGATFPARASGRFPTARPSRSS